MGQKIIRSPVITEAQYRSWDLLLKIIGVPVLIIAGTWTLWERYDDSKAQKKVRQQQEGQEYAHKLFEKKLSTSQELTAKGVLLTLNPTNQDARAQFLIAYRQLQVVADGNNDVVLA